MKRMIGFAVFWLAAFILGGVLSQYIAAAGYHCLALLGVSRESANVLLFFIAAFGIVALPCLAIAFEREHSKRGAHDD